LLATALTAGYRWLQFVCQDCRTIGEVDLATLNLHGGEVDQQLCPFTEVQELPEYQTDAVAGCTVDCSTARVGGALICDLVCSVPDIRWYSCAQLLWSAPSERSSVLEPPEYQNVKIGIWQEVGLVYLKLGKADLSRSLGTETNEVVPITFIDNNKEVFDRPRPIGRR
jgi:hypothetical protein